MTFYERLEILCEANNEKPTTLCKAITKSPGNLDTWKKGNARLDHIKAICDRYNCSADYLLGRQVSTPELSENESILLSFFRECSENSQKILLDLAEHYSKQDESAKEKEKISV